MINEVRTVSNDRNLACILAAVAGALNTAGFYIVGLYSSNMTGNVSALADQATTGGYLAAAIYLALVVIFIAGAATSTVLINAGRRSGMAGVYAVNLATEAVLLAGLGCADLWLPQVGRGPLLAFGLSFLMGLQNAMVTRISDARIRTTHVTGMITDIGIELGHLALGTPERVVDRAKLRLHGATVAAFLVGGMAGVLVYQAAGALLFFVAAALLLALAIPGLAAHRTPG